MSQIGDIQTAARGNQALRTVLENLSDQTADLKAKVSPPDGPPKPCQFGVGGVDGTFIIDINNPGDRTFVSVTQMLSFQQNAADENELNATVTHELRSCRNRQFDVTGDVRSYGPEAKIRWEITDTPDETRFWQLRSSYDAGKTWNAWTDFKDPVLCGVVPVWSGQVRSTRQMPNAQTNVTNYATVDTVPGLGGLYNIRVYGAGGAGTGWFRQVGATFEGIDGTGPDSTKLTPFPAATLTGYAVGSYDIYYDKINGLYRVFTFPNQYADTLTDTLRFVGRVTTGTTAGVDGDITLTLSGGHIVAATINNGGSDYTTPPTLIVGGDGTGGSIHCTISGGSIVSVTIINAGTGYTVAPVTISGGHDTVSGGGGTGGGTGGGRFSPLMDAGL
jgi:hypothetical protein